MFKSKRNRGPSADGPASSSARDSSSRSSHHSSLSGSGFGGGREVTDLGLMQSIPYDRLGPGSKVVVGEKTVSSRTISSPNTNPSLTSDGMPYSSSPSGPPGHRRELSNSTSRSSIRVSRPSYDDSSATPTSSSSNQIQSQQQDHDPLARTHSIASSVASQRTAQSSQSHSTTTSSRRTHNPLQHASSPYQDRPSSPYNQSFADQQQQQHPSHSASTSSSRRGPVEPSFASGSREASQASVNSRSLGRYPTFEAGGGSSSLYSASEGGHGGGGGGGGGSSNGKERMNLSEEFHFPRPSKDEVDRLFEGLMANRESSNGALTTSRSDLKTLPDDKKWLLVLNDAKIKWAQEKDRVKRESQAREMGGDPKGAYGRDSPEWYIQKFMDGTVTSKHVASLSVSLRTLPVSWFRSFIELQGQSVLSSALGVLNNKHQFEERLSKEIDLEYEIMKCLKILLNSKHGANDAINHPHIITHIACSLSSPHLSTRKLVADILTFLCYWDKPRGHEFVIQSFSALQTQHKTAGKFDIWFEQFLATVDGRGRMGSLVGVSEDLRKGLGSAVTSLGEGGLNDYAMANLFLIHGVTTVVDELEIRVHLRSQMEACGLKKVLDKMKQFGHTSIDRLISQIESEAEDDAREIAREFNQDVLKDLGAPQDVFNALLSSVEGTRAHDFFLSSMQHLLLIREDDDTRIRYFQLIDQLISAVVLDQKGANGLDQDFSSLMGVSVNKVVNRFADQDRLDKALANAAEMKATAQQLALEKAAVEEELAQSGQGLVQKLQDKLAATEELLKGSRAATKKLELELEEMKKMYEERIASLELRIQELFNMLRESRELENVAAGSGGTIDRAEMIANLERQHELKKTIQTLEGRHRRAKNGLAEVNRGEGGAFEDGEESSDGMEAPEIALVEGKIPMSKAKGKVKSTKLRRDEVKSGSQFLDAEEERVREHIEQSLADGLDKLNSPGATPRSARGHVDLRRSKATLGLNQHSPALPSRFLEELNGRRFSRSASAPVRSEDSTVGSPVALGSVMPRTPPSRGGRGGSDEGDSDATDNRASGSTSRTDSSLATSIASSLGNDRKSFLSGTSSQRQSRSSPQNGNALSSADPKTGEPSSLQTLSEDLELHITTPEGTSRNSLRLDTSSLTNSPGRPSAKNTNSPITSPSPASNSLPTSSSSSSLSPSDAQPSPINRPIHPFAAAFKLKNKSQADEAEDGESDADLPEISAAARPFNPMAGVFAQINTRKVDPDDEDAESDSSSFKPQPAASSRPPHPFLSQISSQNVKLKSIEDTLSESPTDSSSKKPYAHPAFLGGIAGGLNNLKSSSSRPSSTDSSASAAPRTLAETFAAASRNKLSSSSSDLTKAVRKNVAYKASAKVRQLHWTKIQEIKPDEANVWSSNANEQVEMEWAEKLKSMDIWSQMEATFSSQDAKLQIDKQKQVELLSVLEPKIRRMVEIFMKGHKIDDPSEISTKILSCDEKYCTLMFLESLSKFLPTPEQVGKLLQHKTDTVAELMLLHEADRLMVQLIKIPRLPARVRGMLYRARFEEKIALFEEAAEQIRDASVALQGAAKFRQLLSLILLIGNYLNGNSYGGGAFGFKIDSINKLVETKSPQGQNLLHFVERTVSNLFHDMEGFLDELEKVAEGSRHDLKPVGAGRKELADELESIESEIKNHLMDEPVPGDRYSQRMLRFVADARDRIEALNDRRIMAEATYNDVLRYFGEDPTTTSNVFFGIFKTFVISYKQCQKQNLSWAELEAAKVRRKEAADQRAREKAERDARIDETAPVMDNIMDSLKSMQPRRTRRAGRSAAAASSSISSTSSSGFSPTTMAASLLSSSASSRDLLGGLGAGTGGDFGGQAMSILNTLRNRGFGGLPVPVEVEAEGEAEKVEKVEIEAALDGGEDEPSAAAEDEKEATDSPPESAGSGEDEGEDDVRLPSSGDTSLVSTLGDDDDDENGEGEGDKTVSLDEEPSSPCSRPDDPVL